MAIRLSILAFALLALGANAAEVLRVGKDMTNIAVSHDGSRTWSPKDRVCVLQRAREVGCGTVIKTTTKGAIVRLDAPSNDILAGDKVISKFQSPAPAYAPPAQNGARQQASVAPASAPLMNSVGDSAESEIHSFNLAGGVGVGTSFFYPSLSVQYAVSPTIALGITGFFLTASDVSTTTTLTQLGGVATVNYYSQEYFRGLWVQAGAGLAMFTASGFATGSFASESYTSFVGLATVGWRGYWDLGLNIGVGAGFQYTSQPVLTSIVVNAAGFQPMLVLDVGFSFF
jgi:hypothetical protein